MTLPVEALRFAASNMLQLDIARWFRQRQAAPNGDIR